MISKRPEDRRGGHRGAAREDARASRARLPGRAADARLDAASDGDLAAREGDVTDDAAAYAAYGRGTVEPGDRPAVLVVDYQKAFTTDGLGMGGSRADRARRRQHGAPAARVAREHGRARVPVLRLLRRGGGRARAVEPQGAEARRDHGRLALGRDRRARCWDPSDSLHGQEVAVGVRRHAAHGAAQRAARRHRDRHRLHDVGLRPGDDRRRLLERLPDARARGCRRRPGAGSRTTPTCSTASGATPRSRRPTPASSTCASLAAA